LNILYLKTAGFNNSDIGGSITHTIGMANGFVDIGSNVTFLSSENINGVKAKQEIIKIKKIKKIPYLYNYIYAKYMKNGIKKWLKLGKKNFDFIYCRYAAFFDAGLLIAKKLDIPCILEFNSFQTDAFRDVFVETAKKTHGKIINILITIIEPFLISIIKKLIYNVNKGKQEIL